MKMEVPQICKYMDTIICTTKQTPKNVKFSHYYLCDIFIWSFTNYASWSKNTYINFWKTVIMNGKITWFMIHKSKNAIKCKCMHIAHCTLHIAHCHPYWKPLKNSFITKHHCGNVALLIINVARVGRSKNLSCIALRLLKQM